MRDLDKALSDIGTIRSRIAAGTDFRGYGPAALATTGVLAVLAAAAQTIWPASFAATPLAFLATWGIVALLSAGIVAAEMRRRADRHHSGLADAMIRQAVEQFLPAAAAGMVLPIFLYRFAPEALWMMPGLWLLLAGLGVFAALRSLPRAVALVGAWYFVAGIAVLVLAADSRALSPWQMGLPFAIGQGVLALLLHRAFGGPDGQD